MKHLVSNAVFSAIRSSLGLLVGLLLTSVSAFAVERATAYEVWLEDNYNIHRTGVLGERLTWVIERNGYQSLGRNAQNETSYTYISNQQGNRYVVFLDAWQGDRYAPVSNKIGYVYGVEYAGPVISSELAEVVVVGDDYQYQIAATGHPTRLWAEGLPPGLKVDRNGQIYGKPQVAGRYAVTLYAENTYDSTSATLRIDVVDGDNGGGLLDSHTLVVDENLIITRTKGDGPISSQLTWIVRREGVQKLGRNALSESRYRYYRNWEGGEFTVHLESAGERVSNIVAYRPTSSVFPVYINSASSHSGTLGEALTPYTITANLPCDDFSASDLPSGLRLEGNQIVGVPVEAGSFPVTLSVAGDSGYATALLTIEVDDLGAAGYDTYTLTYLSKGKIQRTGGKQPGLVWVVHSLTGELRARLPAHNRDVFTIPPGWGEVYVALEAWIDGASQVVSNTLLSTTVPVDGAHAPVFTMLPQVLLQQNQTADPIEIEAVGSGVVFTIEPSALPEGLSFDGSYIRGTPVEAGRYAVDVQATNTYGSANLELQLIIVEAVSQATSFTISHEGDGVITRSSGSAEKLRWVVYRNGYRDYEYADRGKTSFHFLRSHLPGDFVIYLEAIDGKRYVRVSNMLSFRNVTELTGPLLASPRDYVLRRGFAVSLPMEFSGDPYLHTIEDAPTGLNLISSTGVLAGTAGATGLYEATITATDDNGTTETPLSFLVADSTESGDAVEYLLRLLDDHVVVRSPGEETSLFWTVVKNGQIVFRKRAGSHLNYSYHRDFLPGEYSLYLEAYRNDQFSRVSNEVSYSVVDDFPLIDYIRATTSGGHDSSKSPEMELGVDAEGGEYVAYTYSLNTSTDEFSLCSQSSPDMINWEDDTFYERVVLSADENHEIRKDYFRVSGAQMFYRYSIELADE